MSMLLCFRLCLQHSLVWEHWLQARLVRLTSHGSARLAFQARDISWRFNFFCGCRCWGRSFGLWQFWKREHVTAQACGGDHHGKITAGIALCLGCQLEVLASLDLRNVVYLYCTGCSSHSREQLHTSPFNSLSMGVGLNSAS